MRSNNKFLAAKRITKLAEKMVERKKDSIYLLVYSLLKLTSTLPIATTSVEGAFSAINIVKSKLYNKIRD